MICTWCGSTDVERVRNIISNGTSQVYELCLKCNRNARGKAIYLAHADLGDITQYRVINDYCKTAPACDHCGSTEGTEFHHWAPQHIFQDANYWPGAYLCRTCHRLWAKTLIQHILTCPSCKAVANGK